MVEQMLHHLPDPLYSQSYIREILSAFEAEPRRRLENSLQKQKDASLSERLSLRELEILSLIAQGASNKEIADKLTISEDTMKTHVKHILHKLDARNRTDAIAKARSHSLLD